MHNRSFVTYMSLEKRAEKWGVKVVFSEMEPEVEFEAKHVINHAF